MIYVFSKGPPSNEFFCQVFRWQDSRDLNNIYDELLDSGYASQKELIHVNYDYLKNNTFGENNVFCLDVSSKRLVKLEASK